MCCLLGLRAQILTVIVLISQLRRDPLRGDDAETDYLSGRTSNLKTIERNNYVATSKHIGSYLM